MSLQTVESSVNESSEKYTNAVWRAPAAGAVAPSACGEKFRGLRIESIIEIRVLEVF